MRKGSASFRPFRPPRRFPPSRRRPRSRLRRPRSRTCPARPVLATAGPTAAVVETPARDASPTVAPTRKARVKPTAAPEQAAASATAAAALPTAPKAPPQNTRRPHGHGPPVSQDRRLAEPGPRLSRRAVHRHLRRLGRRAAAARSSRSTSRAHTVFASALRSYRDLIVDLIVRSTSTDDKVTIDRRLEKGTPDGHGPTGSRGKAQAPELPHGARRRVQRRAARHDGLRERPRAGPASKFAKEDFQFADMAVYEVLLTAPGYESKSLRILVGPAAGELRANVKEKLKKM